MAENNFKARNLFNGYLNTQTVCQKIVQVDYNYITSRSYKFENTLDKI